MKAGKEQGFFGSEAKKGKHARGLASSKDTASYYSDRQDEWQAFSKSLISAYALRMKKGKVTFGDVYRDATQQRAKIARQLQHGKEEGVTRRFGHFREPGERVAEFFFQSDTRKQPWAQVKAKVFELMNGLLDMHLKDAKQGDYRLQDHPIFEGRVTLFEDNDFNMYELSLKSSDPRTQIDGKDISTTLNKLIYIVDKVNPDKTSLDIEYAPYFPELLDGDLLLADEYFQAALACQTDTKEGGQQFLQSSGKLMHLMAQLLPVQRGNAGICEWILRAMAESKGLALGPFNHEEGISWDFKALLSPAREDYAAWFSDKAFLNVEQLTEQDDHSANPKA